MSNNQKKKRKVKITNEVDPWAPLHMCVLHQKTYMSIKELQKIFL